MERAGAVVRCDAPAFSRSLEPPSRSTFHDERSGSGTAPKKHLTRRAGKRGSRRGCFRLCGRAHWRRGRAVLRVRGGARSLTREREPGAVRAGAPATHEALPSHGGDRAHPLGSSSASKVRVGTPLPASFLVRVSLRAVPSAEPLAACPRARSPSHESIDCHRIGLRQRDGRRRRRRNR